MLAVRFNASCALSIAVALYQLSAGRTRCLAQGEPGENPRTAVFQANDAEGDGLLTEAEYLKQVGRDEAVLRREFQVFDANADGRLSLAEFVTIPAGQTEAQRGVLIDPVILLMERALGELTSRWAAWDSDGSDQLSAVEFAAAGVGNVVRGLETTKFGDWDLNRDRQVTRAEAARVLEIAFGVVTPEGEPLRNTAGRVVDWRMFRTLKFDRNGFVSRENYFQALGSLPEKDKETWYASIDHNRDGRFNYTEFATCNHRTDPAATFLQLDVDLNSRLSAKELAGLSADQLPIAKRTFPGFDDDGDGALSLREYQLTPLVNLLAHWNTAEDVDSDGKLDLAEFRLHPGLALRGLSAEYFRRLDVNEDQSLSLDEFPFTTSYRPPIEIYVQSADGKIMSITIPDYPIICSPEISPDGKWIAVDGWKRGQNNLAAHLLFASLERDEVRDLGVGCIPHWSADGRRFAYSKYGRGVFIRDFEGDGEEESIDPQGWAIHFSTDGTQVAYVKRGNLVIHDLATEEKRFVFPDGASPYNHIEHNFTWSPDSQRISFKGHRSNGAIDLGIVLVTGGDPKLRVRCDGKEIQSDFSWTAEGNRLMFPHLPQPGQMTQLFEIDPDGDKPFTRYPTQPAVRHNGGLCWSRDGKTLVYMSTK